MSPGSVVTSSPYIALGVTIAICENITGLEPEDIVLKNPQRSTHMSLNTGTELAGGQEISPPPPRILSYKTNYRSVLSSVLAQKIDR
jgi:hypothetical protein